MYMLFTLHQTLELLSLLAIVKIVFVKIGA